MIANTPETTDGAAAFDVALDAGVWRRASNGEACGLIVSEALMRIVPGLAVNRSAVAYHLREIETGALEGLAKRPKSGAAANEPAEQTSLKVTTSNG